MIIQSARLRVTLGVGRLARHVFHGAANEAIAVLHGDADDLGAMQRDAAEAGQRYAIRHFKVSPGAAVDRMQMARVMRDVAREFGFRLSHCVVIEHLKPRIAGGYERHWHLLAPEWDPVYRRVLNAHWMRPRQEKLARLAKLRLGHPLVAGRWNRAVSQALAAEGHQQAAAAVAPLAQKPLPDSAYTGRRHQAAGRKRPALPAAKTAVGRAWTGAQDASDVIAILAAEGIHLRPGDKERGGSLNVTRGMGRRC